MSVVSVRANTYHCHTPGTVAVSVLFAVYSSSGFCAGDGRTLVTSEVCIQGKMEWQAERPRHLHVQNYA